MARTEPAIFTNMCMIRDGSKILVQRRKDPNWPGVTFPGGHVEKGESFVQSTVREIKEETGLDIADLRLCGVKHFTQKDGEYRYIVFFYRTDTFSGELVSSDEGEVFWIERKDLEKYQLANGFLEMLDVFEREEVSENYFWFDGEWKSKNL